MRELVRGACACVRYVRPFVRSCRVRAAVRGGEACGLLLRLPRRRVGIVTFYVCGERDASGWLLAQRNKGPETEPVWPF